MTVDLPALVGVPIGWNQDPDTRRSMNMRSFPSLWIGAFLDLEMISLLQDLDFESKRIRDRG